MDKLLIILLTMYLGKNILNVLNVLGGTGNVVTFACSGADPNIRLSSMGRVTITSTKNGQTVKYTYSNLNNTNINVQSDANSAITISGGLTYIQSQDAIHFAAAGNRTLQDIRFSSSLLSLHLENCTALKVLRLGNTNNLTDITVTRCPAIDSLFIGNSTNEVANAAIQIMADNAANQGSVFMMYADSYYTDVQNAANASGWHVS